MAEKEKQVQVETERFMKGSGAPDSLLATDLSQSGAQGSIALRWLPGLLMFSAFVFVSTRLGKTRPSLKAERFGLQTGPLSSRDRHKHQNYIQHLMRHREV